MAVICPAENELVEPAIDRILTQYRESPNLIFTLRTYLRHIEDAVRDICGLPEFFDIGTAVGDQLTLLGKRMGWPRCHCVCNVQPVFGFECEGVPSEYPLVGFCEDGTWLDCGESGFGEICVSDDEIYRGFLLARRYQMMQFFDLESLTEALRSIWGDTASVVDAGNGRVVMTPGRELTATERAYLQLVPRVLPIAPGIRQRFHFGDMPVFGFGTGWGGFCEEWAPDGLIMSPDGVSYMVDRSPDSADDDTYNIMVSGPLTRDAEWLCETDVNPYDCATA